MADTNKASGINTTLGYAGKGALIGSVVPGLGTAAGFGIGAAYGGLKTLLSKKAYNIEDWRKANEKGGYVTIPKMGVPGHPEWKPGTRQWMPPGTPIPDESGRFAEGDWQSATGNGATGSNLPLTGNLGINYDAIRERAIAPTRAAFAAGMRETERSKALQGGYAPGYSAQMLALARGQSQAASDASINAETAVNNAKMGVAGLQLQEQGLNNQYALGQRGLDLQAKGLPSGLDKGINTTSNLLGLIGQGAGAASSIWGAYNKAGSSGVPTNSSGMINDWNTGIYS